MTINMTIVRVKLMTYYCFGNLRSCYQLGTHTLSVPVSLHATNRKRLCDRLKKVQGVPSGAIVLLQGGEQKQQYCSDRDILFRQVNCFCQWTIKHPGYLESLKTSEPE